MFKWAYNLDQVAAQMSDFGGTRAMAKVDRFRFRRLDHIGAADAEEDLEYLKQCFVDTGDLEQLRDVENPRARQS